MIKYSVMYPSGEGAKFDHDYYVNSHIPLVKDLAGDALKEVTVDRGVSGRAPGDPPTYLAVAHLVFDSVDDLRSAMAPHGERLAADASNYTNTSPVVQVSEIAL